MCNGSTEKNGSVCLSGIADEAGVAVADQIRAHGALGWRAIELRTVGDRNVAGDLPDADFERVAEAIEAAGLTVTAFASAIGNWSRSITGDFQQDIDELRTAAGRMRRLGVRYIRTMSWVGEGVDEACWRDTAIGRYRELARIAQGEGVVLAHENCTGWGGLGPQQTRALIEAVGSDHLVTLFDIGNTISHGHDPWAFYQGVRDLIGYVHVKDCRWAADCGRSQDYVYPGEGDAMVLPILKDLLAGGYHGVISIEPHVARVIHVAGATPDAGQMYDAYLRYARAFEALIAQAQREVVTV